MLFAFRVWFIKTYPIYLSNFIINTRYIDVITVRLFKKIKIVRQYYHHDFLHTLKISKLLNMTKFCSGDFCGPFHSITCIFPEICIPTTFHCNWLSIFTWGITSTYTFLITSKTRKCLCMHKYLLWYVWNFTLSDGQNKFFAYFIEQK